jgi:hypothetical protein
MRTLPVLLSLCILAAITGAAPVRERAEPSPPAPEKKSDLSGECRWGTITQTGKLLKIDGKATLEGTWDGHGVVRDDGTLSILWRERDQDRTALSVYQAVGDGRFIGTWGWAGECNLEDTGALVGNLGLDEFRPGDPNPPFDPENPCPDD